MTWRSSVLVGSTFTDLSRLSAASAKRGAGALDAAFALLPAIDAAGPSDLRAAARKPVAGLGVTRRKAGSLVIYEIGPGPKALHGTD